MFRPRTLLRLFAAHPVWGAVAFSSLTLVVLWVLVPQVAQAASALENALIQVVGAIIGFFVYILGQILIKFIAILVTVAQFNNFIDAPAVKIGWSVTRDISNMFFIVALLLIAVGTMFRIDQYRYSRTLQKLIMMAILINFSKAIAGFFIDFSQVVMLTFVNAFKDQAAGSLSAGFGIDKLLALSSKASAAGGDISTLSTIGSLFAVLVMVFVATVVVGIFMILLIQRIIMLWIYIVLAPTAYMVAVLPGSLGSWWSSWWRDFSQYLIKGPVIAFFLWLALTIITLSSSTFIPTTSTIEPNLDDPTFVNEATTGTAIINYLVAIGMLIAGLQQAAKSSGAAGAVAGKWMGNFNKWGSAIATSPLKAGGAVLKRPAYGVAGGALGGAAAAFNSKGLAWTGLGTTFGKMNARLTRKRQKSEEKDSDWINYADDKTKQRLATSSFALTEGGRINQKNARESMIKNNQFRGLTPDQKDKVIQRYRGDIGHSMKKDAAGNYFETAADAPGAKILRDYQMKKDPLSMVNDLRNARANHDGDLEDYWKAQIEKSVDKMTTSDFNDMEASGWKDPANADFRAIAMPRLQLRAANPDFARKMRSDVNASNLTAVNEAWGAYTGRPTAILFRRGKQEEGATAQQQRDAARRSTRVDQREQQVHDISGLRNFVDGKSNKFGMDSATMSKLGIDESMKGGFANSPEDVRNVAGKLSDVLEEDIKAINQQIVDVEKEQHELSAPSTIVGSSGETLKRADVDPKRAKELQKQHDELEYEKNLKRQAITRLGDNSVMKDVQFFNRDQHPSFAEAKTTIAHEGVHATIAEMDPDKSFRKELLRTEFTPDERGKMRDMMSKKLNAPFITYYEAFDEYLTEGMVNEGRYAEQGPDAVRLKPGLALEMREKAEEKKLKFKYTSPLPGEEAPKDIEVPERVSTTGVTIAAAGRQVKGGLGSAVSATKNVVAAPFRNVSARVAASKAIAEGEAAAATQGKLADEQQGLDAERAALQRLEANQREKAAQELAEQKMYVELSKTSKNPLEAKTAAERANAIQAQIKQRADAVIAQRKAVADGEARVKQLQSKLQGPTTGAVRVPGQPEMMRKEAFAGVQEGLNRTGTAKANLDATLAARNALQQEVDRDEAINKQQRDAMGTTAFKGTAQQLKSRQQSLAQREQVLQGKKAKLAELEGIVAGQTQAYDAEQAKLNTAQAEQERIDRKGQPLPPPPPAPATTEVTDIRGGAQGRPSQVAARRVAAKAGTRTQSAPGAQTGGGQPVFVGGGTSTENATVNVTNNTVYNIREAYKAAPASVRANLTGYDPDEFNKLLNSTPTWRVLKENIERSAKELMNSEKMEEVGRKDLQKRISSLGKHFDENNAPAFTKEFNQLKNIFGSGSTEN